MSAFTTGVCSLITGILIGLALCAFRSPSAQEETIATQNELVASLQTERVALSRQIAGQFGQLMECRTEVSRLGQLSIFDALAGGAKP